MAEKKGGDEDLTLRGQRHLKPEEIEQRTKAKLAEDEEAHEAVRDEQIKAAAETAEREEAERKEDREEAEAAAAAAKEAAGG